MGKTMTQKILESKSISGPVGVDGFAECELDIVLGNDITTPVAIEEFDKMTDKVFDKDKVVVVMDHFAPAKDIASANLAVKTRAFVQEQGITHFYEAGEGGIEHAILPEKGIVKAGDLVIGADSHTCTYGALGAVSTGVGSTDMASGMALGTSWFKMPRAIKVELSGKLNQYCSGKDVILSLIGKIGVDGASYMSLEFTGPGVAELTMDDRFSISNMGVEAGAKNAIFPVDEKTREYMRAAGVEDWEEFEADEDAEYDQVVEMNLSEIQPTVAAPHLPENTKNVDAFKDVKVDQAVIGSCTNGRIQDMRQAAEIMKGRKAADGVRTIVIPASQKVYKQCMEEGLASIFIDFGAVFSTPTCGPCLGGYMGILGEDEVCISTTNRNFVGRMGEKSSKVYLSNPQVAAASAVTGYITNPSDLD